MALEADVARGTARMRRGTQGHVAEPHESTWSSSGVMWRRRVAWAMPVHADARVAQRGRGGWQVKGPRVSGPSLDSRGGNAHALRRPPYIRVISHFFFRVGLSSREF